MEIDQLIDTLAFGTSAPKITSCLGLYLSPETIYIAETHLDKGKLAVDHLVRVPVPPPEAPAGKKKEDLPPSTAATLTTDFLVDNPKLSALIRQSMSQIRWGTREVMVTLSHHLGLLRYFTMPAMERQFWKTAVPLEAKKYIPIPFDVLNHDFQVVPLAPDAGNRARQGALIAVTQKRNLANISALLEELDLKLVGMEVAPCSVLRLWETLDKSTQGKSYGQIHFDGGSIRILLSDHGLPVFFRELFLGAESSLADQRKIDLGGCVSFAQKQLGVGALTQIRVSGSTGLLSKWQEVFTQEAGIPASAQDTAGLLGIKSGDWGGYAAIGASARPVQTTAVTLDLGQVGRVSEEERKVAKHIFTFSGLAAALLVGVGLYRSSVYQYRARELSKYRRDAQIESVFSGRKGPEIEQMLSGLQAQADLAQSLGSQTTRTISILKDIVEALPEKVWLTRIGISTPLVKGSQGLELSLQGHAVAPTQTQEQDLAFQFKEKLLTTPTLTALFPDIQITVTGHEIPIEATRGLDPGNLAKRMEDRTSFVVTGSSRRPGQ